MGDRRSVVTATSSVGEEDGGRRTDTKAEIGKAEAHATRNLVINDSQDLLTNESFNRYTKEGRRHAADNNLRNC